MAPASSESRRHRLVARLTGVRLLDLLQDPTEVVTFGSLQRRIFFVTEQMFQPQLLTDGQHVPVIQEGRGRTAERTTDGQSGLLVDADRLFEGIALDVLDQGKVEWNE